MNASVKLNSALFSALAIGLVIGAAGATVALRAETKPPGIWVANIDVTKPHRYQEEFAPMVGRIFAAHGGTYLVRGGHPEAMDGTTTNRLVVVRFPDVETAKAVFRSKEYQDARKMYENVGKLHVIVAEGVTP